MYGVSVEGYKKTNNRINTFVSCGQQKVYQVDKKEARPVFGKLFSRFCK